MLKGDVALVFLFQGFTELSFQSVLKCCHCVFDVFMWRVGFPCGILDAESGITVVIGVVNSVGEVVPHADVVFEALEVGEEVVSLWQ